MRILLINPPSPEPLGGPLLGLQYVAAALLARGHQVRVIDAAARCFSHDAAWIRSETLQFAPDLVGFSLFTRWVCSAYQLAESLRESAPLLVAGGAHATSCPVEVLEHGFDIAVIGEAEETIVRVAEAIERQTGLDAVPGIYHKKSDGAIRSTSPGSVAGDLDALPFPQSAQHLFDPLWYGPSGMDVIPGGIISSRGCPSHCTFCANHVTGRGFRFRSPGSVIEEIRTCHERWGSSFFPFWDDALTADAARLFALCHALRRDLRFPIRWSAITRVSMVRRNLLRAMKRAGLASVTFGVESGDDEILRAIHKGITTAQVVRALEGAKEEGLQTFCSFMLGFPMETPQMLERTLRFMERIAPLVDGFNTLGVVVPLPGTALYEEHHRRYGFTQWWLREECCRYAPPPPICDRERFIQHYMDDPALSMDFFHYTEEMHQGIRACLRFKAEHNLRHLGLIDSANPWAKPQALLPKPVAAP